ncbi:MAG TPA: cyclic nucleotide-binding domain-containing protein [Myxococcales bacterium]|nr:cyclic nucleotide-binding domain-containing protein [Myxococcales bacterium]
MSKNATVDVRKLKDEAAEHLKKSRWEKAAEALEQLVAAEPKDMVQRLRLGDTYRRMDQPQKAIESYQHAARFYADEGQLIKAIGAVKIILEFDPRNAQAQKQLAEMNERRMGKVRLARVGLKSKLATEIAAQAQAAPAAPAAPAQGAALAPSNPTGIELPPDDDEPLELDDGKPSEPRPPKEKQAAARPAPAAAKVIAPPPPSAEPLASSRTGHDELELDPALPPAEPELLPDDAILSPEPEELAAAAQDGEVISGEEFKRQGGPIADLLSGGAEEEIELLSISADEEVSAARTAEPAKNAADDEELERAFGNIAPADGGRLVKVVAKKVPLFDDLSQDAFVALVNRLGYHRHAAGQVILREGDPGRSFFIIVEGKVRVYKGGAGDGEEITLAQLGEGAFFGEMALLSGAPRTANVVAEEDTEILEVTDTLLRELATRYPQVISSLKNFYRQRLLNNVMAISPLFKDFDPSQRKGIVEKFRLRQAAPGEKVIAEGKSSDGLYVVLHGLMQVTVQQTEITLLKEGEIFGEMSLLTRQPASATVTAQTNAILLRLPGEKFQELVVTHPQILALVSELTEKRKSVVEAILQGFGEGHDGMSFV